VVDVLVILDGASESVGSAPTSLERASTLAPLYALGRVGALSRVRRVAPGLAPSERAVARLPIVELDVAVAA
jgi:hypothetical protein